MADAGDVRRSVADRASSYSRVVDEGKVVLSGSVSFVFLICAMVVQLHMLCYDGGFFYHGYHGNFSGIAFCFR